MRPLDKSELEKLFKVAKIKPRLRRDLKFSLHEIHDWEDRDFLAVTNRSGTEGVLVVPRDTGLMAAPFRLNKRTPNILGRIEPVICDICATWQRGTNSALITFQKEESTVSFLCCRDLLCSLHIRNKTAAAHLSRAQVREDIDTSGRIERLRRRLAAILG